MYTKTQCKMENLLKQWVLLTTFWSLTFLHHIFSFHFNEFGSRTFLQLQILSSMQLRSYSLSFKWNVSYVCCTTFISLHAVFKTFSHILALNSHLIEHCKKPSTRHGEIKKSMTCYSLENAVCNETSVIQQNKNFCLI